MTRNLYSRFRSFLRDTFKRKPVTVQEWWNAPRESNWHMTLTSPWYSQPSGGDDYGAALQRYAEYMKAKDCRPVFETHADVIEGECSDLTDQQALPKTEEGEKG